MKKKLNFKGGAVFPVLCLLLLTLFSNPAFAYAGIVKIDKTVLSGLSNIYVFAGAKPDQKSTATSGSLLLLSEGMNSNYLVDSTSDATYRIYNIFASPKNPAYLLLLTGTHYAIISSSMGTTVPTTKTFNKADVKFYKLGKPIAPTIGSIVAGYETAKIPLTYSSDYNYSSIAVNIKIKGATSYLLLNTLEIKDTPSSYKTGELIDGIKLETGPTGIDYSFVVRGKVDGVDWSDAAVGNFTTKALVGGAGGSGKVEHSLKSPSTSVNTFALPFDFTKDVKNSLDKKVTMTSVHDLIKQINAQAKRNIVIVFGWYDQTNQKHYGLANIQYKTTAPGSDIDSTHKDMTAIGDVVGNILFWPLVANQPYQASVLESKKLILKGTYQVYP